MGTVDDGGAGMLNTGVPSSFLEHPCTSRKDGDAVGAVDDGWARMLNAGAPLSFLEHPSTGRSGRMLGQLMLWGLVMMVGPGC